MNKISHNKIDLLLVIILIIANINSYSQEGNDFENYQNSINQNSNNYQSNIDKSYEEYEIIEEENYRIFKKAIEEIWGAKEYRTSTNTDWVEYSINKMERSIVDFEKGVASIEIVLEDELIEKKDIADRKLKQAILDLAESRGKTKDYDTSIEKSEDLEKTPVLDNQLQTKNGGKVNKTNLNEYANEVVSNESVKEEKIRGEDGIDRIKYSVSFNLAPDHIRVRASNYIKEVQLFSERYNLPQELIYAVIHTESYFNPKAKSHVPAYGLMQLVPKSGARDAYMDVFKKDKILTANYLFQPNENIELGSAYLRLLINRHFKRIKDSDSRLLCAIASYNTGAGNFSRAFTGRTNPKEIIHIINGMTYTELFDFLNENLPYEETKGYIQKTTQRMKKYHEWNN